MAGFCTGEARAAMLAAYEDVRDDSSDTRWCAASYSENGKQAELTGTGAEYSAFVELLGADQRVYGYVRYQMGDEMSKRAKFVFVAWIGPDVKGLKRAKVSTDKAFMKQIFSKFGVEILTDDISDLEEDSVKTLLAKAGGANYGSAR